jgi:hypothetical protein
MIKKLAMVWGVVFVLVGIAGFIPGLTSSDDMGMKTLLGLFMVNGVHNAVHLLTGVASLASSGSEKWSKLYFQLFGVVYALVTVLGFAMGSEHYVLGIIPVNTADNFLHLAITLVALGIGFGVPAARQNSSPSPLV